LVAKEDIMKICVCDPLPDNAVQMMKDNGFEVDVKTGMPPEEVIKAVKDYDALIVRSATKVTKEVIDAGDKLKLVVRGGVGVDNIDTAAAEAKGVTVKNTPGASTVSVAEHAMALMLSLMRQIPMADKSMKEGKWEKKAFKGTELYKKTLGLIGSGRIGIATAKRAQGFEMNVLAYDPYADENTLKQAGIRLVTKLDELLAQSDVISLHIPKTKETAHIINKKNIDKMKDGAILINAARGGTVDEKAVYDALKSGKLKGAALDVFEKEPLENSPLYELDNVILTPHLGATTKEGQARVGTEAAQTIIDFFK